MLAKIISQYYLRAKLYSNKYYYLHPLRSCSQLGGYNQKQNDSNQNIEVAIIGAASDIGSNLAVMLRHKKEIHKLHLYDDSDKVHGIALELSHLPGEPTIYSYAHDCSLPRAICNVNLIVMVSRKPRKPGYSRQEMLVANVPAVHKLCRVVADYNRDAFLAISTSPINSIIPLVSTLLTKYCAYNPFKLFGITQIDAVRSRAFAATMLKTESKYLDVPVIGGHSDDTIVPLFSNIRPEKLNVNACQADTLTRLVRKAGSEVIRRKAGLDSATLCMAWSINEFVTKILVAMKGGEEVVHSYTANPHYGSRYFASPINVGPLGIIQTCSDFPMSNFERQLLHASILSINKDIAIGEQSAHNLNERLI